MTSDSSLAVVDTNQDYLNDEPGVELGMLHASSAASLIQTATAMATTLADVIERQGLFDMIGGKKHVRVEGWTTLVTMLGCTPREVSNEPQEDGSHVATVELVRMSDGAVISRATSECGMDEPIWANRPRYARRSMAATRATGKACRLAFSWIMTLGGYDATPLEEMPPESLADERDVQRKVRAKEEAAAYMKHTPAEKLCTEKQRKMIWAKTMARADALGIDHKTAEEGLRRIFADLDIPSSQGIPFASVDTIVHAIDGWTLETFGAGEPVEETPF